MKKPLLFALLILLSGCGASDRGKADEYYNRFTTIIVPYKEGTESILKEMQSILREQLQRSGDSHLSREDSVRQRELLKQFETLANTTLEDLQRMDELDGADLKTSGIQYVLSTTSAVVGVYREIVLPMQDPNRRLGQQALDSLSVKYSDQLVASNDDFAQAQMDFLESFGLLLR
jgi:hypothetical protein